MKKFLLLTLDFPPRRGGVARYLDALGKSLKDDIHVLAAPEEGSEVFNASALYSIERVDLLFKHLWPRWTKSVAVLFARRASYETVFVSHVLPLGTAAWIASWVTKKPSVVFLHGMDIGLAKQSRIRCWLVKKILRAAKLVVTNSKALEREVRDAFGVERLLVVYPCVSMPLNHSTTQELKHFITLLTVARLIPRKGHLRVLEALTYLGHMTQIGSLRYRIVGDGPMRKEIEQKIETLGLADCVRLEGELDDEALSRAYEDADIFVMPTSDDPIDREGFGTVYLEAAAHGLPSIATRLPGVAEAVLHQETGLLVADGNIAELARSIETLATDQILRQTLGTRARERVVSEFTSEKQFGKLIHAFTPPSISVIIPTYQHAGTIAACLQSILHQTIAPKEIIVVNDGSTDGTDEVLKPYLSRIHLIHQPNLGSNVARNAGFAASNGAFVIFCDADVRMKPNMLEALAEALQTHAEASYAYCGFRFGWKRFRSFAFDPKRLQAMNFIHTTSLILREHFSGFDPAIRRFQDWDVWLSMLAKGYVGVRVNKRLFCVMDKRGRRGISQWRPSFMFHVPWYKVGWTPGSVQRYEKAKRVIMEKHRLRS